MNILLKKTLLFCFSMLVVISVGCSEDDEDNVITNTPVIDEPLYRATVLNYSDSRGESGKTTFEYDENSICYLAIWHLNNGNRNSINYYTYDDEGNLDSLYREFSDGLTSLFTYEYDQGRLIADHFTRSDGIEANVTYTYDAEGCLISEQGNGINYWFNGSVEYEYDTAGVKTGGTMIQNENEIGSVEFSYDDDGNMIREYWDVGNFNQTFEYEYELYEWENPDYWASSNVFLMFNPDYHVVSEDYSYDYNGITGGPSLYEYNENGKLVQKIFNRSGNNPLTTTTRYLYDIYGNLTESYRSYSDGKSAVYSYEFNELRQITSRSFAVVRPTDIVTGGDSYTYDDSGKLIGAHYDSFDTWLTGDLNFSYDDQGDISTGSFVGNYNAELEFETDDNGNITRIHWIFAFGATQTYTFEYELN